jgi:CTP synthase (UTP-ammonia lyase)
MKGALKAVNFAREKAYPFIGTWGGFQYTLVEYARNVLNLVEADHQESNPFTPIPLISRLSCHLVGKQEKIKLQTDTLIHKIYGTDEIKENYRCNYGLNPEFQKQISDSNLKIVGSNIKGEARIIELRGQCFFIASLFLPQLNSTIEKPHPMIVAYLQEAIRNSTNFWYRDAV